MTADNQPGHKLRLLYIGRRETTTHRLAHFYLREDNGERWGGVRKPLVPVTNRAPSWNSPTPRPATPGSSQVSTSR